MSNQDPKFSRRQLLKGAGAAGLLGAAGLGLANWKKAAQSHAVPAAPAKPKDPKFLIVLGALGGASLIDSFLAIRESECGRADITNCYPDNMVQDIAGSPFRAIDQKLDSVGPIPMPLTANQSNFVKKHMKDMMVVTQTASSVNHEVAQRRCLTGNEIWSGRTIQECVAEAHGQSYAIPNVLLASGTQYIVNGNDSSLPESCIGEKVTNPALWPLSLDGRKGVTDLDPALINQMRILRDEKLDPQTRFTKLYGKNPMLQRWQSARGTPLREIEKRDLITKLMMYPDSAKYPLKKAGLTPSPAALLMQEKFPNMNIDPLESQAALAFLLLKFGVSVTATIAPRAEVSAHGDGNIIADIQGGGSTKALPEGSVINPPIAFDFSHQAHRATQAMMWTRILDVADRLIDLLKAEEYSAGESMWDRTMIYVATDFGRTKTRPAGAPDYGSSHHLNNGFLVISPLVKGNTVLGGVDPDTGLTYGWDRSTGAPDKTRNAEEKEIFAGLLQALDVDTSPAKLPDIRAMRKKA